mgnify:CR=1 FL=1
MKIAPHTATRSAGSELDMLTIRRRVAKIKSRWTPEETQARASEGTRRRRELDALVIELMGDYRDEQLRGDAACCDDSHGLTLVG